MRLETENIIDATVITLCAVFRAKVMKQAAVDVELMTSFVIHAVRTVTRHMTTHVSIYPATNFINQHIFHFSRQQARSQDFTLGATEAARVHFFSKKVSDLF